MKILYLIRGVSGSGKSTFAETLDCPVYSADDYFMVDGVYEFNPAGLTYAHAECEHKVMCAMESMAPKVAVANTFTREWEMGMYYSLAEKYGYIVFSLIVENRHGGKNEHGVPDDKVQAMRNRFEIQL